MSSFLLALVRGRHPLKPLEIARAGSGAILGIAACGVLARLVVEGALTASPLLVAPVGASAVLVFAVPASPLAQPRAVIGGNVLSALVGVTCALLIGQPLLAAGVAVGMAIMVMAALGCLHPPGGAVALGAALAASTAQPLDYRYALIVGLCSALIVAAGAAYARVTKHSYPHRVASPASAHKTRDTPAAQRVGYTSADLDRALAQYGELLDVGRDDLDALFRQVEVQASRRIHAQIRCADIMSRDVVSVDAGQTASSALAYMQAHDLRTAPVVDDERRVVGMVRRAELLAARDRPVAMMLDPFVHKVMPSTAIEALLPILSSGAAHEAMVVDENRVLVGIITQTDLLAVLYRAHVVEAVVDGRLAA
jgi:CBS domain-containing membrane protein